VAHCRPTLEEAHVRCRRKLTWRACSGLTEYGPPPLEPRRGSLGAQWSGRTTVGRRRRQGEPLRPLCPVWLPPEPGCAWMIGWRGPHEAQGELSRLLSHHSEREPARAARNVMKRAGELIARGARSLSPRKRK
jgi:hypothetical protein